MGLGNKTERDLLIELCTDVKWLKAGFTSHLASHATIRNLFIAAMCTATVSLILFGLNLLFQHKGP